ncbi:2,3-dihydro-2,3-dihydroxybenzoate dehydrogenase [Paracoccus sp. P2]|uniref:2,3-dihydro-2,3-dihydroxybenzoate dehydrogenase n=1 Tax=Paracoccus pantotrophus TaxID=82367 RepID=A0A1I5HID4_PARPN|nr:2,3-dihydro-2,3-dihydroxybenzoate dehydrogenase [Paracoccus pantotrophus]MDF3854670.1 2,3-dihydro-2,3-dihydroxybenzoate dehydrogenase [Paracoccus pantotrophus]QFG38185.1 2,3-dihydro-2,3-dihydroxybenzoate dehydrogenase [Paracoccus pantotrophus]QLH15720.1 2,3-dihydro-2,3-dihydroxybenzoate dehydrogenase [Paracoccus pantotrophus]RDD94327.1 2,3-dihydro-2,3-dihydroxybenzoate dehydrogenase [Paracoccus pantotrophus]RKS51310.1 2,3-dihydro-2,3-dihydroxybenzoate dehydrogenase [Paracoccus pantotrophus]
MRLTGFQGRTAIVTGAAGGIGRAVVAALLDAGAKVVASDTESALAANPVAGAENRALDVRDGDAVEALVAEVEAAHGPLGLGVHAAGVLAIGPLLDLAPEEWERVIGVNARGTFNITRAFGRAMVRNGGGAIVAVSSNAAGIPRLNMGAYAASKAAATMLVRCLGLELAAQGVRCNIVAPGSTLTPMQTGMWTEDGGAGERAVIEGSLDAYRTGIPLKKLATPEDIAGAVMFMLSDQAGHVTMADLYVDGGATLRA